MSVSAARDGYIYPLIDMGVTKADVLEWWEDQSFDLRIPEHRGNCVTCWKKSERKLLTIATDDPGAFDFMARMERDYAHAGAGTGPRVFFRGNQSVADLLAKANAGGFRRFDDTNPRNHPELDTGGSCAETCEAFADE